MNDYQLDKLDQIRREKGQAQDVEEIRTINCVCGMWEEMDTDQ